MVKTTIKSLTIAAKGISNVITSPVNLVDLTTNKSIKIYSLWDTGATGSMITTSAVKKLGLLPKGKTRIKGVHSDRIVDTYAIKLILNNADVQISMIVAECDELSSDGSIEMLIGMDVISRGDFAISNFNGDTVMSFRIPSVQKIDFVELQNAKKPFVSPIVQNRNDQCSCGSGKKYKHCHGKM